MNFRIGSTRDRLDLSTPRSPSLALRYASGAPWNDTRYSNARFDELLVAARAELDEAKRAEMYREIQIILRDDGGNIIPAFASNVFALSDRIGHEENMSANWELDGRRAMERWWFN